MEEKSEEIISLICSLRHPDKKVIRQAAEGLISMAPHLPQLTERLNRLLGATPEDSRWPIAYVLAHIALPTPLCLEVLTDTLGSKDPDLRWAVGLLLVRLGKSDRTTVRLLLDLLKTGHPTQRRMAVYCLRDLELKDPASLRSLVESLQDPDPLVRVATATSLRTRPDIDKDGLDSLLHLFLADPDSRVRHAAALSLAHLGAPTEEIHAALKDASQSNEPHLRKAASVALTLLQKRAEKP